MPRASEASTSSQKSGGHRKPYKRPDGQQHRDDRHNDRSKGKNRDTGKAPDRLRRPPHNSNASSGSPTDVGISKIKSSLRQTKRLLAKDNLASDARQEAERRLVSLEQDLEARQSSEHDRKNAERYHKIRFFERQKLVRQIKKIKKALKDGEDSKSSSATAAELHEKRVLLNYVLNFPTKYKYVALFPSHGESPLTKPAQVAVETEASRRAAKTYEQAQEVRQKVIRAMEKGELSNEPEVELDRRGDDPNKQKRPRIDLNNDDRADAEEAGPAAGKEVSKKQKKSKSSSHKKSSASDKAHHTQGGIEGDDFFASDDE